MKLTWKMLVNLTVVVVLGLIAVGWAVTDLMGLRLLADDPDLITVRLGESGGALPGAEVTYLGVRVGEVTETAVVDDAVEARLEVEPEGPMADRLRADVRRKTSLGEPYVDLSPADDATGVATDVDGMLIDAHRTSVPPELGGMLAEAEDLLGALDPAATNRVIDAVGGVAGHEQDLRILLRGVGDLGAVIDGRRDELGLLLSDAARLGEILAARHGELDTALDRGAQLTGVLAEHRDHLAGILDAGSELGVEGSALFAAIEDDLDGALDGVGSSVRVLAERPRQVEDMLIHTPRFVTRIGLTFDDGYAHSSVQGFPGTAGPTYGLPITGKGLRLDRLILPSVAERLEVDGAMDDAAVALVGPEEAEEAAQGEEEYERLAETLVDHLTEDR
jgi:phospholipid/cholesterol/gamma-HCH transport system substrate-binding protein